MKIVFIFACLFSMALTLAGCASTDSGVSRPSVSNAEMQKRIQAVAKTDHIIVPGQRVGPIRLGMAWDEVIATLGKPDWSYINDGDRTKNDTEMDYNSLDMEIRFDSTPTPAVTSIRILAHASVEKTFGELVWSDFDPVNNVFQTAQGIGLGTSSFQAARIYGTYKYSSFINMDYPSLGLYFTVTKDHRIWSITVR